MEENATPKRPVVEVVNYNEKCFAVFGDHKPMATEFRELRGIFNPRLTHPVTKVKPIAGWVFPHKRRESVDSIIKKFT